MHPEQLVSEVRHRKTNWWRATEDDPAGFILGKFLVLSSTGTLVALFSPHPLGTEIRGRTHWQLIYEALFFSFLMAIGAILLFRTEYLLLAGLLPFTIVYFLIANSDPFDGEDITDWLRIEFGAEDV